MKLALLKGNRFNPWHLQAFTRLRGNPEVVAFRAESEIQQRFERRDDGSSEFSIEPIYFDTQTGNPIQRGLNIIGERYQERAPRIVPFHDRLKDFDLIQTWELFTDWTAEALRAREKYDVPVSVMVWDNIPFNMEQSNERREMKAHAAANADLFLVHTERSRRTLDMEGVPEDRIVKINPGVDTTQFSPGNGRRTSLGVQDDEFVILFVGWLLPRKGIDFLILALRELTRDSSLASIKFRLLVVGSGPGKERVEALLRRTGMESHCTFLDSLPYNDMPNAYRAADLFVLPSIATAEWQEQFGMSLLETMACGLPVVSTYSGAIPEIIKDAGTLCQPNDFLSLYNTIRELATDSERCTALGNSGRERALKHFTLDAYAQSLSDAYDTLLKV